MKITELVKEKVYELEGVLGTGEEFSRDFKEFQENCPCEDDYQSWLSNDYVEITDDKLCAIYKFTGYTCITQEDDNCFSVGRDTYKVLTDCEADAECREYIRHSLWAFKPEFLQYYCILDSEDALLIFKTLQEKHCESCNESVYALVKDRFDDLIEDAVSSDGRGHFLAPYDFAENEEGEFFIYKQ